MTFRDGVVKKDKVDKFWENTADLIKERVSRKVIKKRAFVKEDELRVYVNSEDPQLDLEHLTEETRMRIDSLHELLELKTRMKVDRARGRQMEAEYMDKT